MNASPRLPGILLIALAAFVDPLVVRAAQVDLWHLDEAPVQTAGASVEGVDPGSTAPSRAWLDGAVSVPATGSRVAMDLPDGDRLTLTLHEVARHESGGITMAGHADDHSNVLLTFGGGGVFGDVHSAGGRWMVNTDADGTWLLRVDDPAMSVDTCGHDHAGQPLALPSMSAPLRGGDPVQLDVMILYPESMTARYPGGLLATRVNHLVSVANQAMSNSQAAIVVRLVHHQQMGDPASEDNGVVLMAMREALAGAGAAPFVGLDQLRAEHGADLVIWTWPHDIETRGSCGIAFLPDDSSGTFDATAGVHVVNDGNSNWSVCSNDVFTHELGHNLGALHQRFAGQDDDPAYAYVADGRFNTVMSSFGSNHGDRFRRLALFSNPDIQCGGEACGSSVPGDQADQVQVIGTLAPIVADYQPQVVAGTVTPPPPSNPDSDGDGVSDWLDPYPFDPYDDEPPPSPPLSPFDPLVLLPGDQASNLQLLVASSGNDQVRGFDMQGRAMGVVATALRLNPRPGITEHSDLDVDDEGRLYLLANGDVHRYSRERGQLIDVFLSSLLPPPPSPDLMSGFQRAMGFNADRSQLVVLGDYAIERFGADGTRLTTLSNGPSATDPAHWDNYVELPLRAFAFDGGVFYLAEALQDRIMRFDSVSGERLSGDVTAASPGLVEDPRDLVVGPDGALYLADGRSNRVLRFAAAGTAAGTVFVAPGSGGLDFARALAFGPDGDLYVASRDNNRILRYDGASGAFIDVFVDGDGLEQPEAIRFAPKLDLIFRDGLESP